MRCSERRHLVPVAIDVPPGAVAAWVDQRMSASFDIAVLARVLPARHGAMIARQLGRSVMLLERGKHPAS